MYDKIRSRKSVPALYEERLISDDVLTSAEAQGVRDAIRSRLDAELAQADDYVPTTTMLQGQWKGLVWPASEQAEHNPATGVARSVLEKAGRASVTVPADFVRPSLFAILLFYASDDGESRRSTRDCKGMLSTGCSLSRRA
jgi:probable 2-oxoglutarate dehydrogenase E1 component DHKTD1